MNVYAYTPASDTTELAKIYRGPGHFNAATTELHLLDLRPNVTRVARPSHWDTVRRYGWLLGLLIAGLLMVAVTW